MKDSQLNGQPGDANLDTQFKMVLNRNKINKKKIDRIENTISYTLNDLNELI